MIPNLATVDGPLGIYRGGQPDEDGWRHLAYDLCVKHIIKLNTQAEGSDQMAIDLGMDVMECPITESEQVFTEPDIQGVQTAVAFIQPNSFIHCGSTLRTRHAIASGDCSTAGGQDRTGLVVGAYRLTQGWSKTEAYEEMKDHGFHSILFGLSKAWTDLKEPQAV